MYNLLFISIYLDIEIVQLLPKYVIEIIELSVSFYIIISDFNEIYVNFYEYDSANIIVYHQQLFY